MNPYLKVFDIVPGWVYAAALAALLVLGGVGGGIVVHQRDAARVDLAQLTAKVAKDNAERERVARVDAEQVAHAEFRHAELQQEKTDENAKRAAARAAADAVRVADGQRVRDAILAAPGDRRQGEADAATCRRDGDLARQLSADLAEAVGLQDEAEAALRRRDDEVTRLLEQIHIDREAVENGAQGK